MILEEFKCSDRIVRRMKKCVQERGVLGRLDPKKGRPLAEETKTTVRGFYREPDVTKELAGKKGVQKCARRKLESTQTETVSSMQLKLAVRVVQSQIPGNPHLVHEICRA